MGSFGAGSLAATLLGLQERQETLHSKLSDIQRSARNLEKVRLEQATHSLDSLPDVFNAIRRLDRKERTRLLPIVSARQDVARALSNAERNFAISQCYLKERSQKTYDVHVESVEVVHIAAALGSDALQLLEDIQRRQDQLQAAQNQCEIAGAKTQRELCNLEQKREGNEAATQDNSKKRARWRIAHNSTKYIPVLNVVTYPITRLGKSYRNFKSEDLEYHSTVIKEQQDSLANRVGRLRNEKVALSRQYHESFTLQSQTHQLLPQATAVEAESKKLHEQASSGLNTAQTLTRELLGIKDAVERLQDLSNSSEYWRVRADVLESLKALVQSVDDAEDEIVHELYGTTSQETREVLEKAIQQCERPMQWYEKGWNSSRSLDRKAKERGEL